MNLKEELNRTFINDLATKIAQEKSDFNKPLFIDDVFDEKWKNKELKERIRWITTLLNKYLKIPYKEQVDILTKVGPNYSQIPAFIFSDFVHAHGINDMKTSFKAMASFTPYSSAEFAIRPFIEMYPKETMQQLIKWSLDKNHHLRRLASEGTRPKLPWAPILKNFVNDPSPVLPILENLKNDDSLYVRKSVANHLNDISKDHPKLVLKLANEWYNYSNNTNWILKHALRTLLKKGDKKALTIFGLNNSEDIFIENLTLSKKQIQIGDFIYFEFDLLNKSSKQRDIRLEYIIDFVKANGTHSKKVFQISEFSINPNSKKSFKRKQSFKDLTTRKHYAGKHKINIIVNGDEKNCIPLVISN